LTIRRTKKKFPWFINKNDLYPAFNEKKFQFFLKNSFHEKLGWIRKYNSVGFDRIRTKKIRFKISKEGYRSLTRKKKRSLIATFGDSYVFARQVKDNETWQEQISKNKPYNILNYGVGNYGFDQGYLRYKITNLNKNIKFVIIGFVPETICRIQSEWKHFIEFGNIHGFKPKFILKKDKLKLKPNSLKKNTKINQLKNIIKKIQLSDRFYKDRFKKNIFEFPYIYCFLRNFKFNLNILLYLLTNKLIFSNKQTNTLSEKLFSIVVKRNIREAHKYYNDDYSKKLFYEIAINFKNLARSRKHIPIIIIFPQLIDLKLKKTTEIYQKFFKKLSKDIHIIDLTSFLLKKNLKKIYTNDRYGGHFSKLGNKTISKIIFSEIKNKYIKTL
jgi:hypothetical protein